MRGAWIVLATVAALALQTTVARVFAGFAAVDLVLVVVVYVALAGGPLSGLLTGAAAGLVQDALSSSLIGIGSLAKTIVGFSVGFVGTQFIVNQPLTRFVVFFAATVVHAVIFVGLYAILNMRQFGVPYAAVAEQAVGNAVIGVVAFQLVELLPGAVERRRLNRTHRRR
jgi:rod shape-determining protein MreD